MEDEVVARRAWVSRERFLELLGASQLVPGPSSTELAIHLGYVRAGWPGFLAAGAGFILPAALVVTVLAAWYARIGALPAAAAIRDGVQPVVIAIVAQALLRLARSACPRPALAVLAVLALVPAALGADPLALLAACALAGALLAPRSKRAGDAAAPAAFAPAAARSAGFAVTLVSPAPFSFATLFAVFLKIGALVFGSGYVLLAFLRADLVLKLGWLSERQLLDAVAIGQLTPGPVFTTATFVGYLLGGVPGAGVATLAIFLPAFALVAVSGPLLPLLRRSRLAAAALAGVNAGSLALMAVVTFQLARAALTGALPVLIGLVSATLLWRTRLNAAWLLLGGAAIGLLCKGFAGP